MKVSGSERAGEFGLAEEQAGWVGLRFKENRRSETRRNYSWLKNIVRPGILTLLRVKRRRKIKHVVTVRQGPSVPIYRAGMLNFYEGR
jgi:hypothetical protein